VAVLDGLQSTDFTGVAHLAVSATGTLVYAEGEAYRPEDSLARVDLRGAVRPLLPEKYVSTPAFSPDGRIAVRIAAANDDIWIFDPGRELLTRFTLGFGDELHPIWTPDGKHIIYSQGRTSLFWKAADGSGEPEPLLTGENQRAPGSVSPDGSLLAFSESGPQTRGDIWLLPLVGERRPRRFLATPFNETSPEFSPDGRWIAYVSDESGREEIYLQAVQAAGGKRQISTSGGTEPVWSRGASRLFFLEGKTLLAVEIDPASGAPGPIEPLFELPSLVPDAGYGVAPDGTGFVMVVKNDLPPATELRIVLNWFEELNRLVPAGK
jgi:serine/threonine-protein kinase